MQQLAINNQFGYFVPNKKNFNQSRKKNSEESIIPAQQRVQEYRDSGYCLDLISELTTNQSLTPEQIAKGKIKNTIEEINALYTKYQISNFDEIKSFLSKNRFLISLLEEIPSKIYQYFSNSQKLALQIIHETDFPEDSELWIYILTELPAKEALPILEKFDEEWWLENMDRSAWKLNINLKFV